MRITIKTAGLLGRYLPGGSAPNRADIDVGDGVTPQDVMKQLGMPLDGSYLVIVNGSVLTSGEQSTHALAENDNLAIMPPLKGG